MNLCVEPAVRLDELSGRTGFRVIEERGGIGVITSSVTAGLVLPKSVPVILLNPGATPVTRPFSFIVATVLSELVQATCDVMSPVELSEYVPAALNCKVFPISTFA